MLLIGKPIGKSLMIPITLSFDTKLTAPALTPRECVFLLTFLYTYTLCEVMFLHTFTSGMASSCWRKTRITGLCTSTRSSTRFIYYPSSTSSFVSLVWILLSMTDSAVACKLDLLRIPMVSEQLLWASRCYCGAVNLLLLLAPSGIPRPCLSII